MKDEVVLCVLAGFLVDLALGDPRWLPHPVRVIGKAAAILERVLVAILGRNRFSGTMFTLLIVGGSGAAVFGLERLADRYDHRLSLAVSIVFIYTAFAARDLDVESGRVYKDLRRGDLPAARKSLGMIVGRDTDTLDEREISRGAVESVAESTVDGVIAPLLFAILGGAPAAIAYKAASTLDSMVGHRTERYLYFGWASARLDDVLNYLPARLARLFFPVASALCGFSPARCWSIAWRDGGKSPSPNAGIPEAAMAGALGVRLGGVNFYDGRPEERPGIGDPTRPLEARDIRRAVGLMYATSVVMLVCFLAVRVVLVETHPWTR